MHVMPTAYQSVLTSPITATPPNAQRHLTSPSRPVGPLLFVHTTMARPLGSEQNPVRYYIGSALLLASDGITFGGAAWGGGVSQQVLGAVGYGL